MPKPVSEIEMNLSKEFRVLFVSFGKKEDFLG